MAQVEEVEYETRRAAFMREAGEAFDRMMKEDQEQMITFDQMEDRALEVGGKLERWLMEGCLAEAARRKGAGPAPSCPRCRQPLRMRASPEERGLRGRSGAVSFRREGGYCPSCRKAFFPSGRDVEAGR